MIILYAVLYFVAFIATFYCFVRSEIKYGRYVSAGELFLFTLLSIIWPMTLVFGVIFMAYEQLEKLVNK